MKVVVLAVGLVVLWLVFFSSSEGGDEGEWRSAQFPSMSACLEAVRTVTGSDLNIATDKPDRVSGRLSQTNQPFMCTKKETGSLGTFYEAMFRE